jgi:hypothetical protein
MDVDAIVEGLAPVEMWPIRIRSFAPSHRQFRLDEGLTAEQITAATGVEPTSRPDGDKVTLQWAFWAEATFPNPTGGHLTTSIGCKIWDYEGARWSAYGWPEAFASVGLVPIMEQDYGGWVYKEDGNDTLEAISLGLAVRARLLEEGK